MKMFFKKYRKFAVITLFAVATIVSFLFEFQAGEAVFFNFADSVIDIFTFIPFLFILVGLFDVWVPKEKVQKHVGKDSGIKGMVLMILFAMCQAGPLYSTFPVAYTLFKKGASIRNIFIYLGAFSSLKIPVMGIEIGFLGIQFTMIRTLISLPLFIGIAYLMERFVKNKNYKVIEPA
jgi:uncharacterized membrane protein YraQ (UPF0718 family)